MRTSPARRGRSLSSTISLIQYTAAVGVNRLRRRQRQPRVRDNPMASLAHEVMVEAERAFRRADALAAGMEPHLLKRVNDSAIYGYTNDRLDRNVPPGDVLLAAALAAGISIDQKLGLTRDGRDPEMDDMWSQIAEMREEMANLRAELTGRDEAAAERPKAPPELAVTRAERAAQRRALARRSEAAGRPSSQPTPRVRRSGRGGRP